MNHHYNTTITERLAFRAWLRAGLVLAALAVQVIAHGGFDHVIGTVVKVENNVLTVKTAKGDVDVKLNDKTEITRNDQKAQVADLKPGTRVVVDVPEGSKDRVAHSVKVGVTGAANAPAHTPKK
jgi:VCBS repeat-containing protein